MREAHTKHVAALTATSTLEDKVDSWCGAEAAPFQVNHQHRANSNTFRQTLPHGVQEERMPRGLRNIAEPGSMP